MNKTIHFEGIPGSGKSTAAERFTKLLKASGVNAEWWLEESADHPVMPKVHRALSRQEDFPEICLEAWQTFLVDQPSAVAVLEGYAFQSTVRFMVEQRVSRTRISDYFRRWQEIAPDTFMTYLYVDEPETHFHSIMRERGEAWTSKLITWVESTPFGRAKSLQGEAGFVEFWTRYQDLCVGLLEASEVEFRLTEARSLDEDGLQQMVMERMLVN